MVDCVMTTEPGSLCMPAHSTAILYKNNLLQLIDGNSPNKHADRLHQHPISSTEPNSQIYKKTLSFN
jgi:hypothetical protein